MEEVINALRNPEAESLKYAVNTETEYGWNAGDLEVYGRICYIEGMIDFAKANGLYGSAGYWEEELKTYVSSLS